MTAADARYCALAAALQVVADWFNERDGYGNVPTSSMDDLDAAFQQGLPHILDEDDTSVAVTLTRELHDEVVRIVTEGEQGLGDLYP